MNGTSVKKQAEVKLVTSEGIYLVIENTGYFASFADFPYLADISSQQIFDVQYCGHGHIRWEEADIDLHTKILAHPEAFPLRMQTVKAERGQPNCTDNVGVAPRHF
jgi:hypothetical protein